MRTALLIVALLLYAGGATAAEGNLPAGQPPVYFVLVHSPGPKWQAGLSFQEQPGVDEHVRYMGELFERGLMVMGGPFLDDSGGMMISRTQTIEEARRLARDDPAVRSGLLNVKVHPWLVPMRSTTPEN
jgi:uncharacterized protein YciI